MFLSANGNSFKRLLVSDVKTNHALKCEVSMCDLDQVGKSHSYKAEVFHASPSLPLLRVLTVNAALLILILLPVIEVLTNC